MTITVPPEVENSINAAVQGGFYASVDEAMTRAARLLLDEIQQRQASVPPPAAAGTTQPPDRKPIWEVIDELRKSVPPEEFAKLPKDGASQHDHYIYGSPKRENS